MTDHTCDFPFEPIKDANGDYFAKWSDVTAAGYDDDQVWSVVVSDDEGDEENTEVETWTYGPPHHIVNLLGYVATKERHDHKTYYHEVTTHKLCPECEERLWDEDTCTQCADLKAMNEIAEAARPQLPGFGRFSGPQS